MARPFIPRDRPKSWVIFVLACLAGLLFGIVAVFATWRGLSAVESLSRVLFFLCWLAAAMCWLYWRVGTASGQYHNLPERPWRDQVW